MGELHTHKRTREREEEEDTHHTHTRVRLPSAFVDIFMLSGGLLALTPHVVVVVVLFVRFDLVGGLFLF